MRRIVRWTAVGLGGLVLLGVVGWLLFWPLAFALAGPALGALPPGERIAVLMGIRGNVATWAGSVAAGVPLVVAVLKFVFERDKHYNERLTTAMEQRSSDTVALRAGGIQALEELLHERRRRGAARKRARILHLVTGFLRARELTAAEQPDGAPARRGWIEPDDITSAVAALRDRGPGEGHLDLRGTAVGPVRLSGVDLRGSDLSHARLDGADLTGCDLTGAALRHASLAHADLAGTILHRADATGLVLTGATGTGADLRGCDLTDADLRDADLSRARFDDAVLVNTDLRGADLRDATGLTANRLRRCRTDPATTLPAGL